MAAALESPQRLAGTAAGWSGGNSRDAVAPLPAATVVVAGPLLVVSAVLRRTRIAASDSLANKFSGESTIISSTLPCHSVTCRSGAAAVAQLGSARSEFGSSSGAFGVLGVDQSGSSPNVCSCGVVRSCGVKCGECHVISRPMCRERMTSLSTACRCHGVTV